MEDQSKKIDDAYAALKSKKYLLAREKFEELARCNYDQAHLYLGWIYDQGLGITTDPVKAEYHYRRLSEAHDSNGMYYLATLLQKKGEIEKAHYLYEKAADLDHVSAAYWSYIFYSEKSKEKESSAKSDFYLKKAAKLGHIFAQRDIAIQEIKNSKKTSKRAIAKIKYMTLKLKGFLLIIKNDQDMRVR